MRYNLSESGVQPLTVRQLLELAGTDTDLDAVRLGCGQSNGSDTLRVRFVGPPVKVIVAINSACADPSPS